MGVTGAQVNSRYLPQLQQVLQWPQSAGIVGGRPSSSLYFIGHQGQSVLFLDPHEVQEVRVRAYTQPSFLHRSTVGSPEVHGVQRRVLQEAPVCAP